MLRFLILPLLAIFLPCVSVAGDYECQRLSLAPVPGMTRVEISFLRVRYKPVACLVMCPGINGDGQSYFDSSALRAFAEGHRLALAGVSFASNQEALDAGKGYYSAAEGSGKALLSVVDARVYGNCPLLLYGFSGGAHFVSSFVETFPERVTAWCAYSAAWWEEPKPSRRSPPGVVACGNLDSARLKETHDYFTQGRKLNKPWCYLELTDLGHSESENIFKFVYAYFDGVLEGNISTGQWRSSHSKTLLFPPLGPSTLISVWLPNKKASDLWQILHTN